MPSGAAIKAVFKEAMCYVKSTEQDCPCLHFDIGWEAC